MMKYYLLSFCFFISFSLSAQIINDYAAVTAPANLQNEQTITLNDASAFSNGDRVLIIQMQGADMSTANNSTYGDLTAIGNAGNYEFSQILSISGNNVTLVNCINRSYDAAGRVQLIRVPTYTNHTVNTTLTATPWDGTTGGVLVMEVSGMLTLNADIDVSGLGFRGGAISDSNLATEINDYVVGLTNTQDAAQKGEGVYTATPLRGKGKHLNGGGGGNRIEGGGGGGANAGNGGKGGNGKDAACFPFVGCSVLPSSSVTYPSGIGGASLNTQIGSDKIFLGGAGGGGQSQNNALGDDISESGGNGGGIIIIRAQTIDGNGFFIRSNGADVPLANVGGTGGDGQGGGGAGGSILLEVGSFSSTTNVEAQGSDGGDILSGDNAGRFRAPGGGGLVWLSTATVPANLNCDVSAGASGISQNQNGAASSVNGAANGTAGEILYNLIIPDVSVPLAGVYTIGGASPDFTTFAEAVTALNTNGLGGNTTFRLRNGNYLEPSANAHQITTLSYVCGLTTAQLIIESESGNIADQELAGLSLQVLCQPLILTLDFPQQ